MLNAMAIVRMCESERQRGDRSIETVLVRTCYNGKGKKEQDRRTIISAT